jgi:hypothetical protein
MGASVGIVPAKQDSKIEKKEKEKERKKRKKKKKKQKNKGGAVMIKDLIKAWEILEEILDEKELEELTEKRVNEKLDQLDQHFGGGWHIEYVPPIDIVEG